MFGNQIHLVITSDKQIEETTSYVAGGLWEPYASGETSIDRMTYWSQLTYQYYNNLYRSPAASAAGIQQISVYFYTEEFEEPFWKDIPIIFRQLTPEQLDALGSPKRFPFGFTYLSYVAEPKYFLNWMKNDLSQNETVVWETKRIQSLEDQWNLKSATGLPCPCSLLLMTLCARS
jgi:hypothetical protein